MIYIFIAFITGVFVITSMVINSKLGEEVGIFQSAFVNYIAGLTPALIFLLIKERGFDIGVEKFGLVPFYGFLGGVVGVCIVVTSNVVIPKIPAIYSTLLIFVGQIATGIIIDYLSKNGVSKGKIIGSIFILAGLMYNLKIDKKK